MAELVAKGWLAAVAKTQADNLSRILMPSSLVH
jgi:hypothetical protein